MALEARDIIYNPMWDDYIRHSKANQGISFKRGFYTLTGNVYMALILSELTYWYTPPKDPNSPYKTKLRVQREGYYWLARSRINWLDSICITPKQFDYYMKKLKILGYVETTISMFRGTKQVLIRLTDKFLSDYKIHLIQDNTRDTPSPFNYELHESKYINSILNAIKGYDHLGIRLLKVPKTYPQMGILDNSISPFGDTHKTSPLEETSTLRKRYKLPNPELVRLKLQRLINSGILSDWVELKPITKSSVTVYNKKINLSGSFSEFCYLTKANLASEDLETLECLWVDLKCGLLLSQDVNLILFLLFQLQKDKSIDSNDNLEDLKALIIMAVLFFSLIPDDFKLPIQIKEN